MVDYDFEICKVCQHPSGVPTYALPKNTTVYVCGDCGFHYIDYLDDLDELAKVPAAPMTDQAIADYFEYIERALESNKDRFQSKVDLLESVTELDGARCLDIGAGAGQFLHLLRQRGADVYGIEPTPQRVLYARKHYDLELCSEAFAAPHWWGGTPEQFDVVTLWDVIEHVNFPIETLDAACRLLAPGGLLLLDTPARDGFYHRTGERVHRLTRGKNSGFLRMLYSSYPFGHKQIFHSQELYDYAIRRGHEVVLHRTMHELSRPYSHYLKNFFQSQRAADALAPIVGAVVDRIQFINKTLMVMRRVV